MKVRLALICTKNPDFWHTYASQKDTIIHEVIVEIPELPIDYVIDRVMICEDDEEVLRET